MAAISQTIFSDAFSWMKILLKKILIKISLKFVPKGPIGINIKCLDKSLVPNRPQTIILTNADTMDWHIYAALGSDELMMNESHNSWTENYDANTFQQLTPYGVTALGQRWFRQWFIQPLRAKLREISIKT